MPGPQDSLTIDKEQIPIDRFLAKINTNGPLGCWDWTGALDKKGYGKQGIRVGGGKWTMRLAHRIAYLLWCGPLEPGKVVAHHCDRPICVNPKHLFQTTQAGNLQDMTDKGRRRAGIPGLARERDNKGRYLPANAR